MQFKNVTFYFQLLQNIGYISCVVQYILEPVLLRVVCTSHIPPSPPALSEIFTLHQW